jgi:hypothetical protein
MPSTITGKPHEDGGAAGSTGRGRAGRIENAEGEGFGKVAFDFLQQIVEVFFFHGVVHDQMPGKLGELRRVLLGGLIALSEGLVMVDECGNDVHDVSFDWLGARKSGSIAGSMAISHMKRGSGAPGGLPGPVRCHGPTGAGCASLPSNYVDYESSSGPPM